MPIALARKVPVNVAYGEGEPCCICFGAEEEAQLRGGARGWECIKTRNRCLMVNRTSMVPGLNTCAHAPAHVEPAIARGAHLIEVSGRQLSRCFPAGTRCTAAAIEATAQHRWRGRSEVQKEASQFCGSLFRETGLIPSCFDEEYSEGLQKS